MKRADRLVIYSKIIKFRQDGHTFQETADKFNFTIGHVQRIWKRYLDEKAQRQQEGSIGEVNV